MIIKTLGLVIMYLVISFPDLLAQNTESLLPECEVISVDNATKIVQLMQLGRGTLYNDPKKLDHKLRWIKV